MTRLIEVIATTLANGWWLRVVIIAVAAAVAAVAVTPPELRDTIGLEIAYYGGWLLPGQLIAAGLGFLAWNRDVWLLSAVGLALATAALYDYSVTP